MQSFRYVEPSSMEEAFDILERYGDTAAVLAGGTDLVNHIHMGKCSPQLVVQIRRIRELHAQIKHTAEGIEIGALATLTDIAENPSILQDYTALAEAAVKVGSKQIRNRATLVGNLCNASPAADTVPALFIYEAVITVAGPSGTKHSIPIEHFITGPGKTQLTSKQLVEKVFIPKPNRKSASAYIKLSRREGVDLAIVSAAAYVDENACCRLALGAVAPKAYRVYAAEEYLKNNGLTEEAIQYAARAAAKDANPITDIRASREYRLAMVNVLTRQALSEAFERMRCRGERKDDR